MRTDKGSYELNRAAAQLLFAFAILRGLGLPKSTWHKVIKQLMSPKSLQETINELFSHAVLLTLFPGQYKVRVPIFEEGSDGDFYSNGKTFLIEIKTRIPQKYALISQMSELFSLLDIGRPDLHFSYKVVYKSIKGLTSVPYQKN
jgi:hypothetical protein